MNTTLTKIKIEKKNLIHYINKNKNIFQKRPCGLLVYDDLQLVLNVVLH